MDAKEVLKQLKKVLKMEETSAQKFTEATLKDGTIIKYEGDLAPGTAIIAVSPDGEIPAPDGTWELEDGTMITTAAGLITEVVPPTELNADEQFAEKMKPYEERIAGMEASLKQLVEVATKQNEAFEAVQKENTSLKEAIGKQGEVNETILKGLEKFAKAPSAKPAEKVVNPLKKNVEENESVSLEEQVDAMYESLQALKK